MAKKVLDFLSLSNPLGRVKIPELYAEIGHAGINVIIPNDGF